MDRRIRLGGFTLVELLVVIAIIAILAAILYPLFVTVKENAKTSKCQAHQKELVAALMLYTEAWCGRLPNIQFLSDRWIEELDRPIQLYKPYVQNFDILICPTKTQAYAYNEGCLCGEPTVRVSGGTYMQVYQIRGARVGGRWVGWPGRAVGSVRRPSRTPAFFCAKRFHGATAFGGGQANGWGWEPIDIRNPDRMLNKHNGGLNYAFLDGHVKWYTPPAGQQFFFMRVEGIDYDGNGTVGEKLVMR